MLEAEYEQDRDIVNVNVLVGVRMARIVLPSMIEKYVSLAFRFPFPTPISPSEFPLASRSMSLPFPLPIPIPILVFLLHRV